ncbi:MAG: hypothetical protein ACR2RF_05960 [Geminicoccaceae bacterium]
MRISHLKYAGLVAIATAALFSSTLTSLSQERQHCTQDGAAIVAHLEKEWGEVVIAMALNSRDHMVQWLANKETGTWSMVVTMPNDAGCLTAHGKYFDIIQTMLGEPS